MIIFVKNSPKDLRVIICKHQKIVIGGEKNMSWIFMKLCVFYAYVK